MKTRTLSVGDAVKVLSGTSLTMIPDGAVGVVAAVDWNDDWFPYKIRVDRNHGWFGEADLERLDPQSILRSHLQGALLYSVNKEEIKGPVDYEKTVDRLMAAVVQASHASRAQ